MSIHTIKGDSESQNFRCGACLANRRTQRASPARCERPQTEPCSAASLFGSSLYLRAATFMSGPWTIRLSRKLGMGARRSISWTRSSGRPPARRLFTRDRPRRSCGASSMASTALYLRMVRPAAARLTPCGVLQRRTGSSPGLSRTSSGTSQGRILGTSSCAYLIWRCDPFTGVCDVVVTVPDLPGRAMCASHQGSASTAAQATCFRRSCAGLRS
jgi:hypothetical protein